MKRRNEPSVREFWSRHVALWMRDPYSQLEHAERNGISRSLLQRWWVWIREDQAREERIRIARCRRRRPGPMTNDASHMTSDASMVSPAAMTKELADLPAARRRRFTDEYKRHLLDLAKQPGSSISDVAQRYDLAVSLLFRWRKELGDGAAPFAGFTPVDIVVDELLAPVSSDVSSEIKSPKASSKQPGGAMEIVLKDGKRFRDETGADPEAVRRLVTLLEGTAP